jgi:hypothetical protein
LLERELTRLDFELLSRSPDEIQLKTVIDEISNDFRTLMADAQVRGMEKEAAVILSVDPVLQEEVKTKLFDEWPKLSGAAFFALLRSGTILKLARMAAKHGFSGAA